MLLLLMWLKGFKHRPVQLGWASSRWSLLSMLAKAEPTSLLSVVDQVVRKSRDENMDMQLSLAPHEGRVFMDTVCRDGVMQRVVTDCKLYHQQWVTGPSKAIELIFDPDGFGGMVMDDGSVTMLEQWFDKQLYIAEDMRAFVKDATLFKKPVLLAWTAKAQKYCNKDVKVAIAGEDNEFEVYVFDVRRGGGCRVFFRASCFFSAFHIQGYEKESSKWLYDRWRAWERGMGKHWGPGHFFKSTSSKKK